MTLLDLAASCESATGPSFALERDISEALGVPLTRPYTASLDAALMLVPEGCLFVLKTLWDDDKTAGYAIIQHYAPTETGGKRYDGETTALAATPALALCAAALRARAQIEGGTDAPE